LIFLLNAGLNVLSCQFACVNCFLASFSYVLFVQAFFGCKLLLVAVFIEQNDRLIEL